MVVRFGLFSLLSSETEELTPLRRLKKRKRQTDWREVRVRLARPVENKESRTFIARMGQYPELVSQLHSAAVDQGLSIMCPLSEISRVGLAHRLRRN